MTLSYKSPQSTTKPSLARTPTQGAQQGPNLLWGQGGASAKPMLLQSDINSAPDHSDGSSPTPSAVQPMGVHMPSGPPTAAPWGGLTQPPTKPWPLLYSLSQVNFVVSWNPGSHWRGTAQAGYTLHRVWEHMTRRGHVGTKGALIERSRGAGDNAEGPDTRSLGVEGPG